MPFPVKLPVSSDLLSMNSSVTVSGTVVGFDVSIVVVIYSTVVFGGKIHISVGHDSPSWPSIPGSPLPPGIPGVPFRPFNPRRYPEIMNKYSERSFVTTKALKRLWKGLKTSKMFKKLKSR